MLLYIYISFQSHTRHLLAQDTSLQKSLHQMMTKHAFAIQAVTRSTQQLRKHRESPRPTAQGASAYLGMPAPPRPFPLAELQLPQPHLIPSILHEITINSQH